MDNNVKLFRDKMQVLNEEFVDFIQEAFRENPSYDFSPCVTDYLNHVKELDKLYSNSAPKERKIAVARRRNTHAAAAPKLVEQPKKPVIPTVPEPKKLDNGLVEPTGQFNFAPKVQMPAIPTPAVKAPSFATPKSTEQSATPSSISRKRRQDPLDYNDMLGKSSEDYGKSEPPKKADPPRADPPKATLPTMPSLFGNSGQSPASFSFTMNKPAAETTASNAQANGEAKTDPPKLPAMPSLFGASSQPSGIFTFGAKKPDESTASPASNGQVDEPPKKADPSKATLPSMPSLFGNLAKSSAPFSFTMNKPAAETTTSNGQANGEAKTDPPKATLPSLFGTSSQPSLFGNLAPSSAPFSFTLNKPAAASESTTSNAQANDEAKEEEDAPPPKVEAIKHEEPDAVFSTKCSLFNFVNGEYKKVGVGYLHIKKTESDPQLLIRAATALGTVWVNTRINGSFKAEKKAKDKIQFSYPSEEGAKTHLARVVDMEDALAYLTGEKKP